MRSVRFWFVATACLVVVAWAWSDARVTIYDGSADRSKTGTWGNGQARQSERTKFLGKSALEIETRGLYEGGRVDLTRPFELDPFLSKAESSYLVMMVRVGEEGRRRRGRRRFERPGMMEGMPGGWQQPGMGPGMPPGGWQPGMGPGMPGAPEAGMPMEGMPGGWQPGMEPGMPPGGWQPGMEPGMPPGGWQPGMGPGMPGAPEAGMPMEGMPGGWQQPGMGPGMPPGGWQPGMEPGMPGMPGEGGMPSMEGMPPGMGPGGYPGMPGGTVRAAPKDIERVRAVLVTDKGLIDCGLFKIDKTAVDAEGWLRVVMPVRTFQSCGETMGAKVEKVAFFGDGTGTLYVGRASMVQEDTPLLADPGPQQRRVKVGQEVRFEAAEQPQGVRARYTWDFDDLDGITEDAVGPRATWKFEQEGYYVVTLTVKDMSGSLVPKVAHVYVLAEK